MMQLVASLPNFLGRLQDPVHGPHRAVVDAAFKQRRVDLLGGVIDEAFRMENLENGAALVLAQSSRGLLPRRSR